MKQILVFIFLVTIMGNGFSQHTMFQKPNYEWIKSNIQDSSSIFYYPKLMSRMLALDTTLSAEAYEHLYYGYVYQKNYLPYWVSPDEKKLLRFYMSRRILKQDYDDIINLTTHSISVFPFDLRQMNFLSYIYHLKGDEVMARKMAYRFQMILGTILASGNGKSYETAYHVISISHEYDILNFFQLERTRQRLIDDCDFLSIVKNRRIEYVKNNPEVNGLYFNIKKLFEKNNEKLEQK